jgi:trimeric autotransporter adhesin
MRRLVFILSVLAIWPATSAQITYTYDEAHRLIRVDFGNGSAVGYAYDKAGNLLSRTAVPAITAEGVVNAASFQRGPVAPGEMVTIFGSVIGPPTLAGLQVGNNTVASAVNGTRFLFDGVAAPIIYASATQSTVMVPFGVAGKQSTQLAVEYRGVISNPVRLTVADTAPGVFTATQQGSGQAALLNQDYSANSAANPASKGSVVMVYLTGDGQTTPVGADGQLASTTLPRTAAKVTATIGGVEAEVQYAGVAPQSVAGFAQVNVVVPAAAPSGSAVPLVVTVGQASSQPGVTLAIR